MKNQKANYFGIGMVILLCFIIFGFGGNYLKKQNKPLPSPVTTATNAFDNWKIYTNTKLGIEFKYPSELRLQETKDSVRILRNMGYLLDVKRIDTDDDVETWWSKVSKDYAPYVFSKTQFNNKSAYYFKQDTKEVQTPMDMYIIKMNGYILNISYEVPFNLDLYADNTNKETYKISNEKFAKIDQKIIDQILSTFKFIVSTTSTDTSSWTTYTNKTFGYSIKFPETYEVPPQSEKQKNQLGVGNNIIVLKKGSNNVIMEINVYSDKDNMLLEDYMNNNLKTFEITGPLVKYNFNGYDSLFNKNQPGINVFVKQGQYIYHITASTASSDKEVGDIVATFSFITKM